jgi:hypothetical protein
MKGEYMNRPGLLGKAVLTAFVFMIAASSASAAGKKYGLFVGINAYTGRISPLHGAVNDAVKMREAMVSKFGFKINDTSLLTDSKATREAIITNLQFFQGLAGPGDLVVFHYSGHGTLFPDAYSDEQDETKLIYLETTNDKGETLVMYKRGTYDSAIVPVDAMALTSGKKWRNLILDDELYAILGRITRNGAHVVLISDSCHSGSIDRAKNTDVRKRETALADVFGVRQYSELDLGEPTVKAARISPPPAKGLYISMTGSRDDEFSLDVTVGGVPMGLFTSKLLANINSMPAGKPTTYEALMSAVSSAVSAQAKGRWDKNQNPQLNSDLGNAKAPIFSAPAGR